jgi:hypothetical protein
MYKFPFGWCTAGFYVAVGYLDIPDNPTTQVYSRGITSFIYITEPFILNISAVRHFVPNYLKCYSIDYPLSIHTV